MEEVICPHSKITHPGSCGVVGCCHWIPHEKRESCNDHDTLGIECPNCISFEEYKQMSDNKSQGAK